MKNLFTNNKFRQTFQEDCQFSPLLDPKQTPKVSSLTTLKIDQSYQEKTQFPFYVKKTKHTEEIEEKQVALTNNDESFESKKSQTIDSTKQFPLITESTIEKKTPQFSPQKMILMAVNIFNKQLVQIKSTNQDLLTPQQFYKLREKIIKHINDCIALIKVLLKHLQRINNSHPQKATPSQTTDVQQLQCNQNTLSQKQENSTIQNINGYHLDLIQFCMEAFEQLNKYQINYQETITLMEQLFKTFEGYNFLTNLPYIQNIQLDYISILLRCGFLKKAERSFTQMQQHIQQYITQQIEDPKQATSQQIKSQDCAYEAKRSRLIKESQQDGLKMNQKFDLYRYYILHCQFLNEQGEKDRCAEEINNIQDSLKVDAFMLKINMFIERQQHEQALYLIEQGKTIFQRHKQPLVFLQLMNLKLKVLLAQRQYSTIHALLQEIKEYFEQSKLKISIEFCQSLLYESQAYLANGNTTECINLLEEANVIAKEILKDRYNQSSITADIYYFKALCWLQQSQEIQNQEEKHFVLKNAQQICQLCIKVRKNYLYSKQDKNQKVIDALSLNVNLLALTNQNRECRKASAELVEYELI
ncbi:hypothetical protein TTHERM_00049280 (macronuclear) [Tetrahymena thermophila SB210]|uniref:Uncharacterized protein n=1 Tax=Tetrahymena thermophila (strain SB210) TaxID=312017 RepID=Q23D63_TETTS|nr:hypothetical protein TTHERM_00049280 [Tetrahymena thermophila SB210]EAR94606.1 hypothetical protein TTHERM_00049280 [Tetrahymena thermophila SB210]|eukprot:XP_001014823.1 hypothetical protein TTHERM_00049280 [Tetrahymena thermophila SB210]